MSNSSVQAVVAAASSFVAAEAAALGDVAGQIDETFVRIAGLILRTTGKVVVTGAGTSGFIARRTAHLLSVSGTPAYFLAPTDALHGSMGSLRSNDIMIALSKGGTSEEVNELVHRVRGQGVQVIAITCRAGSPLAAAADLAVVLREFPTADPGGLIAMGSTLAHSAWLDALTVVLMRAKQYPWDKVQYTHPGGAVGKAGTLPAPMEPLDVPMLGLD